MARIGLLVAASLLSVVALEIGLRVAGFEFHLYPKRLEFGFPDPKVLENYYKHHDRYLWVQRDWEERLAAAKASDPWIALVGCSCTEWGRFDEPLARLVKQDERFAPIRVANLGVSGWSSYSGRQLMAGDVLDLHPEVVTIFFGWNDHWMGFGVEDKVAAKLSSGGLLDRQQLRVVQLLTRWRVAAQAEQDGTVGADARPERVSLPDFRANLEAMVATAREHDIVPVLITAPTSHQQGKEPEFLYERWIQDLSRLVPLHQSYVAVVREVAAESDVVLCDLAADFAKLPRAELVTLMKEDGIHFTPKGGERVAELLFATLAENGLLPPATSAPPADGGTAAQGDGQ